MDRRGLCVLSLWFVPLSSSLSAVPYIAPAALALTFSPPNPPCTSQTNPLPLLSQGVSGTGKSTLGTALAQSLALPYIEGDDLHPQSNIAKMSAGIPLNDEDREPWLRLIRRKVEEHVARQLGEEEQAEKELRDEGEGREGEDGKRLKGVVVGCSSLKKYYRDILRGHDNPTKPSNTEAVHTPPPESLRQASPASLAAFANAVSSSPSSSIAPPESSSSSSNVDIPTYFIFITGPHSLLYARMEARPGHFMKASMLDSQLATLEDPTRTGEESVVSVSIEDGTEVQVVRAREGLRGLGVGV